MADVSVRPARPEDAERIARVQLATWREAYAALLPPQALDVPEVESSVYLKAMDRQRWAFALVGVVGGQGFGCFVRVAARTALGGVRQHRAGRFELVVDFRRRNQVALAGQPRCSPPHWASKLENLAI